MRLNVTSTSNVHKELVACVGWNAYNELYSVGDDKTVSRWDINGDAGGNGYKLFHILISKHSKVRAVAC